MRDMQSFCRALGIAAMVAIAAACGRDEPPTAPAARSSDGVLSRSAGGDSDDDSDGRPPQSDNVQATVAFTRWRGKSRVCEGTEGLYGEIRFVLTGTAVGDPRLTGHIEVTAKTLVNFTEGGIGPEWGTVVIREAAGGRKKVEGDFNNWAPDLDGTQGSIVGRVSDAGAGSEPTSGAGRLIANWRTNWAVFPNLTAQIGGATTDNRIPAGVWSGRCKGKFEEFDIDLTAPAAATALAGRAGRFPRP